MKPAAGSQSYQHANEIKTNKEKESETGEILKLLQRMTSSHLKGLSKQDEKCEKQKRTKNNENKQMIIRMCGRGEP